VKYFDWDAKNAKLRAERGIGFEDIVFHIERGDLLDILELPNPDRYAGQRIFVVRREGYVYLVPFPPFARQLATRATARSRRSASRGGGRRRRAHRLPEDDHPEPESHQGVPRSGERR
jgi:hypothetical protein